MIKGKYHNCFNPQRVELVGTKALHLDLQWVQKKVEQHQDGAEVGKCTRLKNADAELDLWMM